MHFRRLLPLLVLFCIQVNQLLFAYNTAITIDSIVFIPKIVLDTEGYSGKLALSPVDGSLHAIWVHEYSLMYRIYTSAGEWLAQEEIPIGDLKAGAIEPPGNYPRCCVGIAIDDAGLIHIVFNEIQGNVYYLNGNSGLWNPPNLLAENNNNTTYAQIETFNGSRFVTFLDVIEKKAYSISYLNGQWGPVTYMFPADNPNLALGENGMIYFVAREFIWKDIGRYDAVFGYMIPGFTDWNYVKYITNTENRCGKEPDIAVGGGKIFVSWNNSSGIPGPEKASIYCAEADEPGLVWNPRIGGKEFYHEDTGDPYACVTVYSDGTPLVLNGKRLFKRYVIYNGKYWSAQKAGDWKDGICHIVNNGQTAWIIASTTSTDSHSDVSVTGLKNLLAEPYNYFNHKPEIVSFPDTLAVIGFAWSTQCQAIDSDSDTLHYTLSYAPSGMSINKETGLIQWTPPDTGNYIIGIKVEDVNRGWDARYFRLNVVSDLIKAKFSALPISGTAPFTVQFIDSSVGLVNNRLWDFGDGQTSTDLSPIHEYQDAGIYTVRLTVSGPGGSDIEEKSEFIQVEVDRSIYAEFACSPVQGEAPLEVTFTNQSNGNILEYTWFFGDSSVQDGGVSDDVNPTYTYNKSGVYSVTLKVTGMDTSVTLLKQNLIEVSDPTGIDSKGIHSYKLHANFPNPFNMQTRVPYDLPERADVRIRIFNATGKLMTDYQVSSQTPGHYVYIWNGLQNGMELSSGVYLLQFKAGWYEMKQKIMLIK